MPRLLVLLFLAASALACEGPVGPAGPPGERGPQGETGPPGASNMRFFTVTINASDFNVSGTVESNVYSSDLITQSVMDAGAVLAYTDLGTGESAWFALPFSVLNVTIGFAYELGEATILIQRPDGVPPVAVAFQGDRVRFVVLSPSQNQALKSVDREDYEEVLEALTDGFQD